MRLLLLFVILWVLTSVTAHVCDDVLRGGAVKIRPESEIVKIEKMGEFKVFLKNDYRLPIDNVTLTPQESPFDVQVTPQLIERVECGQEVSFSINITIPEAVKSGNYTLMMIINAREFKVDWEVNVTLEVEEEKAIVEIKTQEILVATRPERHIIEVERTEEFRVFVRSGHANSIHNVRLFVENESKDKFSVNVTPTVIDEVKPQETVVFLVSLTVPEGREYGDYVMPMEVVADEFTLGRDVTVVVRVKTVRREITYLYLIGVLILVLILIWRKTRLQSKQPPKL